MGALRKTHTTKRESAPARRPLRSFRVRQAVGYLNHLRHRYHRKLTDVGPVATKYFFYPTLVAAITAVLGFRGHALMGVALAKSVFNWWCLVLVANAIAAYVFIGIEEVVVAARLHRRTLRSLDAIKREDEAERKMERKSHIAFSTLTGLLYLAWAGLLVAN